MSVCLPASLDRKYVLRYRIRFRDACVNRGIEGHRVEFVHIGEKSLSITDKNGLKFGPNFTIHTPYERWPIGRICATF